MEPDEKKLYRLIYKALKQLDMEKSLCRNERLYVVLPDPWVEAYGGFFQTLSGNYQIFTVISSAAAEEEAFQKVRSSGRCGAVLEKEQVNFANLPSGISIFPAVPRELLVKTALCIDDTFETKWVRNCIENGWKTVFLRRGMEPLTGKEPRAYADRIRGYLNTVSSYGIEIRDCLRQENNILKQARPSGTTGFSAEKRRPKVITSGDIGLFAKNGTILLEENDLITELAKEKAMELGVKVIRK